MNILNKSTITMTRNLNKHAMARLIYEVSNPRTEDELEEIDGSPIVKEWDDGTAETADGKVWYWKDTSFQVEPGLPYAPDGHWERYHE